MRKLFLGLAILTAATLAGSAEAQKTTKPAPSVDKRPDLHVPNFNWAGDVLYVPVQNKGITANAPTKLRVGMYRKINGIFQLVSTGVSTIPSIRPGDFTSVKVSLNQQAVNCTLIITADYLNTVAEANENNNSLTQAIK